MAPLTVAEGASVQPAAEGFDRVGYELLARTFDGTLVDLNHDEPWPVEVYDWRLRPLRLRVDRSMEGSDFCILVGPPKTHDVVIVTLSLKSQLVPHNTAKAAAKRKKQSRPSRECNFQRLVWIPASS